MVIGMPAVISVDGEIVITGGMLSNVIDNPSEGSLSLPVVSTAVI